MGAGIAITAASRQPGGRDCYKGLAGEPGDPTRAAYLALLLGQRAGDILKTKASETYAFPTHISITFVEGKTVQSRGAFTLATPTGSEGARIIQEAAEEAQRMGRVSLFYPSDTATAEKAIHKAFPNLDLRSLRRTGLTRLAQSGCDLELLLQISRHSSVKMLEIYLCRGLFHGALANGMCKAFSQAWGTHVVLPQRLAQPMPQDEQ